MVNIVRFIRPWRQNVLHPWLQNSFLGGLLVGSFEYLEESWFFLRELENKLKGYFFRLDRLILLSEWELEFG